MNAHLNTEIAVIGAGVIGLTIAHRLARAGRHVTVIDPNPPGSGASYGNAGTIADYAVLPVGSPSVLRNLPSLLFNRNSPLAIRQAALPSLAPWLLRFLRQSLPGPARRNAAAVAALLADATPSWEALAVEVGGESLLQKRGCLYLYEQRAHFRAAEADMAYRRGFGVAVELIGPVALAAMEPALPPVEGGAAFFPNAIFLSDPGQMVGLIAAAARKAGAQFHTGRVERIGRRIDGVTLDGPGFHGLFARVILAAGAHSRDLARQAGDRIPLDTERGYHLEYDMAEPLLSRPASPTTRGFYLCPMTGRLRVAGTVELGGLTAPPSSHRLRRLEAGARAIFPQLGRPDRTWMGFRPSIPDSVPVIGPSSGGADVLLAFGHGHLGLTMAPVTARLIAGMVMGKPNAPEMAATLPQRF